MYRNLLVTVTASVFRDNKWLSKTAYGKRGITLRNICYKERYICEIVLKHYFVIIILGYLFQL